MKKIFVAMLAVLALGSCSPLCKSSEEHRAEARAVAGDIVKGTVRSIGEVVPIEESEPPAHEEDPLQEERRQIVVRLDDGSEVTIVYAGPRELAPGERVRVYLGEGASFLL